MRRIFAVLVLCLGIAPAATADPIQVTSGTIQANDDFLGDFSLGGNAFAASGAGFGGPTVGRFGIGPVDFSGDFGVMPVNSTNNGFVTTENQTFRGFASASFLVVADSIVIPDTGRGPQRFSTAFSARGLVQVFDSVQGGNRLFSQDVTGSGTLSFIADNVGSGAFFTRSMALTFAPDASPSPAPEPGSWLLLGTGLLAAWQSRRFRRARS